MRREGNRALASVLEDLQEMALGIHPAILAQSGLGLTLKALARRSAVPVDGRTDHGAPCTHDGIM